MTDLETKRCIPWNRAQTEERLDELEDNLVDLRRVLYQFTPNHVHWKQGGMPLPFSLISEAFVYRDPIFYSIFEKAFNGYLRKRGLPGQLVYDAYDSEQGCIWLPQEALRFREIDFMFQARGFPSNYSIDIDINTTRADGSFETYQVFTPRDFVCDFLVYERGQQLITAMLEARV